MTAKTAEARLRYAKQFGNVIEYDDAAILLKVPPNKYIHIMERLSSLARYARQTPAWRSIHDQHQLSWSTGTEKLGAFTRFFDDPKDLDAMIVWLKEALLVLPSQYLSSSSFCTLSGMRCSEALE
jgi:hypothetical protein